MNKILIEVSVGELLDKISILEIKKDKIKDPDKLSFISDELSKLKEELNKNKIDLSVSNLEISDDLLNSNFAHLHNHSQFSVLPSTISIKELIKTTSKHNMPAVALTDHANMMGSFRFINEVNRYNDQILIDNSELDMSNIYLKKGHLLIAEPSIIGDMSFNRSIIIIADHNTDGSIGFILNKPLDFTLQDLIPEIEIPFKVYNGGPVEQDNLYYIHKIPELIPNSIEISKGLYWGGNFEKVTKLIQQNKLDSNDIRFFLGYSGWETNQLTSELLAHTWILSENKHHKTIIEKVNTSFWKEKMLELGGDYSIWSNAPENPSYN